MQAANQMEGGGAPKSDSKGNVETMLDFNALQYEMYPDLSVVTERTFKNAHFQRDSYQESTTAFCVLNSGSDYIDAKNSYLNFDVDITSSTPTARQEIPTWGRSGSAYNVIKRIIITDRAGNELERVENVNRLVNALMNTNNDETFFNNYASMFNKPRKMYDGIDSGWGYLVVPGCEYTYPWRDGILPPNTPFLATNRNSGGTVTQYGNGSGLFEWKSTAGVNLSIQNLRPGDEVHVRGCLKDETGTAHMTQAQWDVAYPRRYGGFVNGHSPLQVFTATNTATLRGIVLNMTTTGFIFESQGWTIPAADVVGVSMHEVQFKPKSTDQVCDRDLFAGGNWTLPLRYMSGLFDYDQLLPSQLMSGLRIEINFEKASDCFRNTVRGGGALTYTIKNAKIVLDSCRLTDAIQRELNERSANDGLEIMYRTWFTTPLEISANTRNVNLESRKAVSRAFRALALTYVPQTSNDYADSSMIPEKFNWKKYQYRAGNLYFPNQPLIARTEYTLNNTNKLDDLATEAYHHCQRMFAKHKEPWWGSSQNVDNWLHSDHGGYTAYVNGVGKGDFDVYDTFSAFPMLVADLERTTVQDLSGIPLNNSRVLTLEGEFLESTDKVKTVLMYLQHLKIARVFLDNTEIEE